MGDDSARSKRDWHTLRPRLPRRFMLRGSHLATVDEKGRVKIPAEYLEQLRKQGSKFYVTSATGDHARVYPMKEWEEIEKKLAKRSSYEPTKRKFLERTNYFGQVVEVDGQGRILIPPVLRESAEMKGEVDIQGQLTYLEIWNHARFLSRLNSNPITAEDEKAFGELGI
jgi:MraZ protein